MNRNTAIYAIAGAALAASVLTCTSRDDATPIPRALTEIPQPTAADPTITPVPALTETPTPGRVPAPTSTPGPTPDPTREATPEPSRPTAVPTLHPTPTPPSVPLSTATPLSTSTPAPAPVVHTYALQQGLSSEAATAFQSNYQSPGYTTLDQVADSALGSVIRSTANLNETVQLALATNHLAQQGIVNETIAMDIEDIVRDYDPKLTQALLTMPEEFTVLNEGGVSDQNWLVADGLDANYFKHQTIQDSNFGEQHWTIDPDFEGTSEEWLMQNYRAIVAIGQHMQFTPTSLWYADADGNRTDSSIFEIILDKFKIHTYVDQETFEVVNPHSSVFGYKIDDGRDFTKDYTLDGDAPYTDTNKIATIFIPAVSDKGNWTRERDFHIAHYAIAEEIGALGDDFLTKSAEQLNSLFSRTDDLNIIFANGQASYGWGNYSLLHGSPQDDGSHQTALTQYHIARNTPFIETCETASPQLQAVGAVVNYFNREKPNERGFTPHLGFEHFIGNPAFEMPEFYEEDWPLFPEGPPGPVIADAERGGRTGSPSAASSVLVLLRAGGHPADYEITPTNGKRTLKVNVPEAASFPGQVFYVDGNDFSSGGGETGLSIPPNTLPPWNLLRPLANVEPDHDYSFNSCPAR